MEDKEFLEFDEEDRQGHLWWVKPALEKIIARDRELILKLAQDIMAEHARQAEGAEPGKIRSEDDCIGDAIEFYIKQHRTLDPKKEIEIQKFEIGREKYFRELRGEHPSDDEVTKTWAQLYAAGWRSHNTKRGLYVFRKEKQHYVGLVKAPQQPQ
ncbi:MAG: hypothetical protein QXM31_01690 [Candidatus Woesearchaeota archaeon]